MNGKYTFVGVPTELKIQLETIFFLIVFTKINKIEIGDGVDAKLKFLFEENIFFLPFNVKTWRNGVIGKRFPLDTTPTA